MSKVWLWWRIFFAVVFLKVSIDFVIAATSKSYLGAFGLLLFAAAFFILAAIMVSPDLAKLAARPFTAFIDSIYLPGGSEKKPPLDYKLAHLYMRTGRPHLAESEFATIVHYYPDELQAHLGLAEAYFQLDDKKAADRVLVRAVRRFRKDPEIVEVIDLERQRIAGVLEESQAGPDQD